MLESSSEGVKFHYNHEHYTHSVCLLERVQNRKLVGKAETQTRHNKQKF